MTSLGNSAANSLGECASSVSSPGTEAPSPFLAALERVMEAQR